MNRHLRIAAVLIVAVLASVCAVTINQASSTPEQRGAPPDGAVEIFQGEPVIPSVEPIALAVLAPVHGDEAQRLAAETGAYETQQAPDGQTRFMYDTTEEAAAAAEALGVGHEGLDPMISIAKTPNDPVWDRGWYPDAAGHLTQINMPSAWDVSTGASNVTIAIIDTGVVPTNELAGRLLPGIDYVNPGGNGTADGHGHGTAAASVAAATANNSINGAGVCWTCKILPVRALGNDGNGLVSNVAAGIIWATDNGAHIINLSLAGTATTTGLTAAVNYALERNVILVAAAGNNNTNVVNYPAGTPGVISVGAITQTNVRTDYSNYGSWVDVAAPGCTVATAPNNQAVTFCGTSAASPLVAGTMALARTIAPNAGGPALANKVTTGAAAPGSTGFSNGRINARSILDAAKTLNPTTTQPTTTTKPPTTTTKPPTTTTKPPTTTTKPPTTTTKPPTTTQPTTTTSAPPITGTFPSPAIGATVGAAVTAEAVIPDAVTVTFYAIAGHGTFGLGTFGVNGAGQARTTLNLKAAGDGTIELQAIGKAANGTIVGQSKTTVLVDLTNPALTSSPTKIVTSDAAVAWSASDPNGITSVELLVNKKVVAKVTGAAAAAGSGTLTWAVPESETGGAKSISVRATDGSGRKSTKGTSIAVDRDAPGVTITAPTGSLPVGKNFTVAAQLTDDGGVASATVSVDGVPVATKTVRGTRTGVTFTLTDISPGSRTVTITATDTTGKVGTASKTYAVT